MNVSRIGIPPSMLSRKKCPVNPSVVRTRVVYLLDEQEDVSDREVDEYSYSVRINISISTLKKANTCLY